MVSSALKTGQHLFSWIISESNDVVFKNPLFKEEEKDTGIVVYCVHGLADRNSAFYFLVKQMLERGLSEKIKEIHLPAFDGRAQGNSIKFFAEQLKDKIVKNKHSHVMLMGHSRGGLINSYLDVNLAKAADIHVVANIAICSPFRGSPLAQFPVTWVSKSVRDMNIHSHFLKKLQKEMQQSQTPVVYVTANDDIVVYSDSAVMESKQTSCIKVQGEGHVSVLYSAQLAELLREAVNKLVVPTAMHEEEVEAGTTLSLLSSL